MTKRSLASLFLLALAAPLCRAQDGPFDPGTHVMPIVSGGRARTFLVHVPSVSKDKYPVVVMLHGGGGSAQGAIEETGWDAKADREGFLAVFPEALPRDPARPARFAGNPRVWNDGSERFFGNGPAPDDVAFIGLVLDRVASLFPVDTTRIFFTGFSNGASMTFLAATALSTRVAAAAPVAGALWQEKVTLARPVPLCYLTGDSDSLNPLAGGPLKTASGASFGPLEKPKPPVIDSIRAWARATGCPDAPSGKSEKNGVVTVTYGPGREGGDGAEVVFITVKGMGHNWAGGRSLLPESIVGKRSNRINATDTIWEFFVRHPLKQGGK